MNFRRLIAVTLCLAMCLITSAAAGSGQPSTYKGWKAYVLKNQLVRLHVVPEIGGRVIQFALGEKEFFWVNPALIGKTSPNTGLDPDGDWLNYGGDKLWPAPQGWDNDRQWPGPPDAVLDGQPYRAEPDDDCMAIRLTSRDDPRSGIRFSRRIRLHPHSTRVTIEATMTNVDKRPRRWGIWAHTQLDAGLPEGDNYNKWIEMLDNRDENPYVFESEVLSPFARLQPGESYTWRYEWAACRIGGDFPVVDCSKAGLVSEPLSCQRQRDRVRLRGRFGVFQLGQLVLEAHNAKAEVIATEILDADATPLEPIVLDHELELPATSRSMSLVLLDPDGERIGEVARYALRSSGK